MRKIILMSITMLIVYFANAQNIQKTVIYFDKASSIVKLDYNEIVDKIINADMIYLYGYTDSDGSEDYNLKLSSDRVNSILKLIKERKSIANIETSFFGESNLAQDELKEDDKQLNRRVEITYINNPFLSIGVEVQKFKINNAINQTITGKQGTIIEIPAGVFGKKVIDITLTEHYNTKDILACNLSTTSNNKLIETAGMINISAYDNGKPILPNDDLTYKFPAPTNKDNFEIFYGNRNDDFTINWINENANRTSNDYYITGTSIATEDIAIPSEKFWNNFVSRLETLPITSKSFVCINDAKLGIAINPKGYIDTIISNYKNKNKDCDYTLKNLVYELLPQPLSKKSEDIFSSIQIEFSDFLSQQDKTKYANWLTKEEIALSVDEYCQNKNQSLFDLKMAIYEAEQKRIQDSLNAIYLAQIETQKDLEAVNKIVLNSAKMGWINCDRFLNLNKQDLTTFSISNQNNAIIYLVFEKFNSIMNTGYLNNDKTQFANVPKNEKVKIISAYKNDNEIFIAVQDAIINDKTHNLYYNKVSKAEMENILAKLN